MITEIRIENFYSIGELQTISFIKNGNVDENGYKQTKIGKKLSLINGFFGANASGKTSVLRAMVALLSLMYNLTNPTQSFNSESGKFGIVPNLYNLYADKTTKLGADFLFGDNLYAYDVEIAQNGDIVSEILKTKQNQSNKNASLKLIYKRDGADIKVGKEHAKISNYIKNTKFTNSQCLFPLCLVQGFDFILDFRSKNFWWNLQSTASMSEVILPAAFAAKMVYDDLWIKKKALNITTKALQLFDPSIIEIQIEVVDTVISIKVKHDNFRKLVDIKDESRGTQELFTYIFQIIEVLKEGGVVIYDEINRFFHPDIENALFNLFLKENNNKAQLFFSSHNHEIMNDLSLEQIYLVEKESSTSVVNKLSDFDLSVKSRENIVKKYRLGVYGSIPDMIDFNYGLNELI